MKTRVAVPNSQISKWSRVEANSKVSTESESIVVSGDVRSTETETSSPVIKVYGSTGVE